MAKIDLDYQNVLRNIMTEGCEFVNERTGEKIRALPNITFDVYPGDGFPLLSLRALRPETFIAEQIWFCTGSRRPDEFLAQYTRIWDSFVGVTGVVATAYGWRWRHHFVRDQLLDMVESLRIDKTMRQGVVMTWDPTEDGLLNQGKRKNVPCPIGFIVNIIDNKLNMLNLIRSNDMVPGFAFDIAGFAFLQRLLAGKLGVGVGKYSHSIAHAHIYERHYEAVAEMLKRDWVCPAIFLESRSDWFDRAVNGDHQLVKEVANLMRAQYHPLPAIRADVASGNKRIANA